MGSGLLRKGLVMGIASEAALAEDDEAAPPALGVDVPPVEEAKVEAIPPPAPPTAEATGGAPRLPVSDDVFCRTCFGSAATGTKRVFSRC